ncbi:MAG: M13 family metallopeptidase [Lachnospiraceae bacterium]|nr:M13 family metallopeptidase [Lachnospiraceae bacterium]
MQQRKWKSRVSLLLTTLMLVMALTGCRPDIGQSLAAVSDQVEAFTAATTAVCESLPQKETVYEEQAAEEEQTASASLPMDPSVMTPWINTNVIGMVTDDINAEVKDDLFLSVNHDWLRDVELRPGYPLEMQLLQATDIVQERCEEILADKTLLESPDPETAHDASLVQGIYELFLDWDKRNEVGITPFEPFVERILAAGSMEDVTDVLLSEENFYYGIFPAGVGLGVNALDSSLYEIDIKPTSLLTYGDAGEYANESANGARYKVYTDTLFGYMLNRFGIEGAEADKYMADAFALESLIAPYEKSTLDKYAPTALQESINPVTMEDIREMSPVFPLADYMERYGYADSELINLEEPGWLLALNDLYNEDNLDGFKAYILKGTLTSMTSAIDEEAYRFARKAANQYQGISESMPDDQIAYQIAMAYFPFCFDRIYIDRYLSEEIRDEIRTLCQDAVDTYREMLSETEWLSEETRNEAVNKLDHMTIHAVYPDKWEDDSVYNITPKEEGGVYLDAILSILKGSHERVLSKLNGMVDREIWGINILDTNAYYNPEDNSINIIPGFFCDVSYRSDMPIEEKYGALGTVIGHEISHAFDTNGAQYDADGNVANWWTDEDYAAFSQRAQKVVDFYDNVVAFDDGTPYSGQLVQTEAIADMAGMKCMLKMAEKIEGFDYDAFFRANARLWSLAETLQSEEAAVMSDPHPLNYLRANVGAQQFDEFMETYDVQEGDGMYLAPEDRIGVW